MPLELTSADVKIAAVDETWFLVEFPEQGNPVSLRIRRQLLERIHSRIAEALAP
jgi:hypothetical protein